MASYEVFKKKIKRAEGGYQNLIDDRGNKNSLGELVGTNFGVSAVFYETVIQVPPTVADMKNITQNEAHFLFKKYFWDRIKADSIKSQAIAETFADHAINSHPKTSTRVMQRVLNNDFKKTLVVDGVSGKMTIDAINSVPEKELFNAFSKARIAYYNGLKDCVHFCPIWHNRVKELAKDHSIDIVKPLKKKCH